MTRCPGQRPNIGLRLMACAFEAEGHSIAAIGRLVGRSRQRVWQLLREDQAAHRRRDAAYRRRLRRGAGGRSA